MPSDPGTPSDPGLEGALKAGLDALPAPDSARLAEQLARAFGASTLALVHYGSHAQGSGAAPESAYDFFVVLADYREGYRALRSSQNTSYGPRTGAWLNRILPPNVISVSPAGAGGRAAKCAVFSLRDLECACSPRSRDLWAQARLFQEVHLIWSRDAASRRAVTRCVVEARRRTFDWGRPFLPTVFGPEEYARALLRTAYASEIRPEREERIGALLESQRDTLTAVFSSLLDEIATRGELAREGAAYRDARPPGGWARWRVRTFLRVSKARATLRWAKYVWLYDDWLEYVVRKFERRAGVAIELTPRERRWPLIFLWPRALRLLGRRSAPRQGSR